jgi:hypothetical protein
MMAKAGENFIQDHRPTQDAPEIVQFDDHYSRRDTGVPVRRPQMATHLQIHADTLPLTELLDFAAQDKDGKCLHGNGPCGRDYGKLVTRLAQSIADLQGLYIWGYYESNGLWRTIYLGKAGLGPAPLHCAPSSGEANTAASRTKRWSGYGLVIIHLRQAAKPRKTTSNAH